MFVYLRDRRRRRDTAIAALITVVVAMTAAVIYAKSDYRATTLATGPDIGAPVTIVRVPASLEQIWELDAGPEMAPVVSPYGTIITGSAHDVKAVDYLSGEPRWSYRRSNVALCALGSADSQTDDLTSTSQIHGVLVAYSKGTNCSEISLLNPITGQRMYQRTAEAKIGSTLFFGGPYGGFIDSDLTELWRWDLVQTIQYGNQPLPMDDGTQHLGCTFDDIAVAETQFATIEHCDATGSAAQLVINYADPEHTAEGKANKWNRQKFKARATIDLGSATARLLSITSDKVAVLVAEPEPAVVIYQNPVKAGTTESDSPAAPSSAGNTQLPAAKGAVEIERTEIPISPGTINETLDAGRTLPVAVSGQTRYVLIGGTLVAIAGSDLQKQWYLTDVLGTPAVIGSQLLVPRTDALVLVNTSDGAVMSSIPVDRGSYLGPINVDVVGSVVVETRGATVVGLRSPDAPAADPVVELTATPEQ